MGIINYAIKIPKKKYRAIFLVTCMLIIHMVLDISTRIYIFSYILCNNIICIIIFYIYIIWLYLYYCKYMLYI